MADADDQHEDAVLERLKTKKCNAKTPTKKVDASDKIDAGEEEENSDEVNDSWDEDESSDGESESDDDKDVVVVNSLKDVKSKEENKASTETVQNVRRRGQKQKTEEVKKEKPEKKKPEKKLVVEDPPVPFIMKFLLFMIPAAAGCYFAMNTLDKLPFIDIIKPEHNYNRINIFDEKLKEMKKAFPTQNTLIWNMLKNGGKRHLKKIFSGDKKDLTPQSYLLAGYSGSSKTVSCFVSKLAEVFTDTPFTNERTLDSSNFNGEKNKAKLLRTIDEKLSGSEKLLVINDIDKLPFSVAQVFMSLSDEHNKVASFPQSMLFLTTEVPISYESEKNRLADEGKVGKHFKSKVWSGVHADKAAPLWSRVGDGLMLIREEAKNPCDA